MHVVVVMPAQQHPGPGVGIPVIAKPVLGMVTFAPSHLRGGAVHRGNWQCLSRAVMARRNWPVKVRLARPMAMICESGANMNRLISASHISLSSTTRVTTSDRIRATRCANDTTDENTVSAVGAGKGVGGCVDARSSSSNTTVAPPRCRAAGIHLLHRHHFRGNPH